jgi:hypothetical protein
MSIEPAALWSRLSPRLQAQIHEELTAILQEVIYEQLRTHHAPPSDPQGHHL